MGAVLLGRALVSMHFVASRLYVASAVVAAVALISFAFGLTGASGFVHQSIGALIVAGFLWFVGLAVQVIVAELADSRGEGTTVADLSAAGLAPPNE